MAELDQVHWKQTGLHLIVCNLCRFSRSSGIINKTLCDLEHRQEVSGLQGRYEVSNFANTFI